MSKKLIEQLELALSKEIVKEAVNKHVKYFTKDKNAFFKQFKDYKNILSKDFYKETDSIFNDIIKQISIEDAIQGFIVSEIVNRQLLVVLKRTLNELRSSAEGEYLSIDSRLINLVETWHDEIQKDYNSYIKKNFP